MKEYTIAALVSAGLAIVLDRGLKTHVLGRGVFWIYLAVMYGFMILANGYLTWRPIVIYGQSFYLGIRLLTIPLEDFFFGFSLIGMSVIVWEYLTSRMYPERPSAKREAEKVGPEARMRFHGDLLDGGKR